MEKLELVKDRDFGDNISMAFEFIKQNAHKWQKLFLILLGLALADALCALIPGVGQLTTRIISAIASVLTLAYAASYLKLYIESSDGELDNSDVMSLAKSNMGKIFGTSILFGLALVIGLILLLIPGIYILVSCSFFAFCILAYDLSAIQALSKSHDLVKNNWWVTFGYTFVVGIIIGIVVVIGIMIGVALMELGTIGTFFGTLISSAISFILAVFSNFAIGVYFYNLVDKKEDINISQSIDSIGAD